MTLYSITEDIKAINDLYENAVDAEGNPRELTEEEKNQLSEWFTTSLEDFEKKFDSYGKFLANIKMQAETAEAEKKNFKAESERLTKRAKAFGNKYESVKGYLRYAMENLHLSKYKTACFSAGIQNTQKKVTALAGAKLEKIPEEYLLPREIDTKRIKDDIASGKLEMYEDKGFRKIRFADTKEELPELRWEQGTALVMR